MSEPEKINNASKPTGRDGSFIKLEAWMDDLEGITILMHSNADLLSIPYDDILKEQREYIEAIRDELKEMEEQS